MWRHCHLLRNCNSLRELKLFYVMKCFCSVNNSACLLWWCVPCVSLRRRRHRYWRNRSPASSIESVSLMARMSNWMFRYEYVWSLPPPRRFLYPAFVCLLAFVCLSVCLSVGNFRWGLRECIFYQRGRTDYILDVVCHWTQISEFCLTVLQHWKIWHFSISWLVSLAKSIGS